jgi:hypothetical protein
VLLKACRFHNSLGYVQNEAKLSDLRFGWRVRMAFSEFELKRIEKLAQHFVEANRPPVHIRAQLDLGFRITGQSLELFDIRPNWRNPNEINELPFAKTTYVKKSNSWKIFWMRQDLKWHRYAPDPEVPRLEDFFAVVADDANACFRG